MASSHDLAFRLQLPPRGGDIASAAVPAGQEKKRQILTGAREVFLGSGFEGASMGEIARVAGVSKGTLYVHFGSKQELFAALVGTECGHTAERCFELNDDDDVRAALTSAGYRYVEAMIHPEHISTVRMVIGVAEKFPEVGRAFLSAGTEAGVARLAQWLRVKIARGELDIGDVELAAWQFLIGCHALVVMPLLFGGAPKLEDDSVERVVLHTVDSFIRAFGAKAK
ncbi:MAG TPA: TetR/AcrR family transcriptional regulator [Ancylobacter sp.]